MDEKKLEEIMEQNKVDNSRLEEPMKTEMTPHTQAEFIEILKESQLYLLVTPSPNMFEGIEDAKVGDVFEPEGQAGFDINYLSDADGNKAVPLFTSEKAMDEAGLRSSVMVMYVSDLVDMLKQSDRYAAVTINPFTENGIDIPMKSFLNIFHELTDEEKEFIESLDEILKALKEHSYELEDKLMFIIRNDKDFMNENAVDGVFVPNIPFYMSTDQHFCENLKYTNLLLFNEGDKILPLGKAPKDHPDTIVAPGTEFKIVENPDEFTTVWMCEAQPFYDE